MFPSEWHILGEEPWSDAAASQTLFKEHHEEERLNECIPDDTSVSCLSIFWLVQALCFQSGCWLWSQRLSARLKSICGICALYPFLLSCHQVIQKKHSSPPPFHTPPEVVVPLELQLRGLGVIVPAVCTDSLTSLLCFCPTTQLYYSVCSPRRISKTPNHERTTWPITDMSRCSNTPTHTLTQWTCCCMM